MVGYDSQLVNRSEKRRWSRALEFGWVRSTFANGDVKSRLQHLESYTKVSVSKTPPLLIEMKKDICNIWYRALEFSWVILPPC